MFHLHDDPTPYRVIGIDPGTDTLGVAVLDLDLLTGIMTIQDAQTLHGSRLLKGREALASVYGARFVRLQALEEALTDRFCDEEPHAVICESPFYNPRRPGAYAALVEAVSMVQRATYQYCASIPLKQIDPASAKACLKVSGKSGDKTLVQQAILTHPSLQVASGLLLSLLDEHAFDAIAIAHYHLTQLRAQLVLP